ncbi:hypothetical protein LHJ74_04645 [Streptomyces sp. N2-109]|uniref:Zinc-finger domain-containing protein n=1 Tax=Streptomyces gossypii TaxID=2883101 RepID=A0ABT2JMX0_9ACTN|nr:hypothetical protein [Streptomyces gossypii]MCT2589227.1 hypothetical protein [Streptomyces gossypii]
MTPTSGTPGTGGREQAEHPEIAEISALGEGLLAPAHGEHIEAHLAECVSCTDVRDSLDEIRDILGALPVPTHMPTDIADRIDAALAAEAAAPGQILVSRETRGVSRETHGTGMASAGGARSSPPHTPRAADCPAGRPPGGRSTGTPGGPGRTPRPRRWRRALLASAGALAALGLGGVLIIQGTTDDPERAATADRNSAQETSPRDAQRDSGQKSEGGAAAQDLGPRVRALLAEQGTSAPEVGSKQSPGGPSPLEGGEKTLPSCVREGIGRSESPLAADPRAPYRGEPAYLVILPHIGDTRFVDAYVVAPDCTTGSATGPGEVLGKHTFARE